MENRGLIFSITMISNKPSLTLYLQYVKSGVSELQRKIEKLLELKYGGIHDAIAELGDASSIGQLFSGFQKYLYQKTA